ncbi:DNA cytosine methyltransferase [Pedobacter antarcticus]|uniref:DNA cytosine methyltransferase n=1 Tax=Pedobacter antarcticus TaxID=34086 RepID=UPI002930DD95|nr:DNA cytosine methyltransferase [Pedobacter antarcticus]
MVSPQYFLHTEGGGFNPAIVKNPLAVEFLIIDLFCGAGGTSTGFHNAMFQGDQIALVMACINHDFKAIKSHWLNHPDVLHFEEDIRTAELQPLVELLARYRVIYPNAKIILWASLECTNFSKAKGGQARDADSRTLAEHLDRYILALDPDYVQIENVVEFMSWGPLDEKGKPVSRKSGSDYLKWCKYIDSLGYRNEWKEMNSADFGAYTSRNRLFGCFAKPGLPIVWPESTHAKKPVDNGMFGTQHKWKAVKDVLDFEDEGISIFNRKKPLVDASLERIEAGLIKFVAGGKEAFILKYNSMAKNGDRKQSVMSVENPAPTIPCQNRTGLCFIAKYYSGKPAGKVIPVTGPVGTITCVDGQSLVSCKPFIMNTNFKNVGSSIEEPARTLLASRHHPYIVNPAFLAKYYGTGENVSSVEDPAGTIPCVDRFSKIQPVFLDKTYTGNANIQSINQPAGTVMPNDKHRLINCQPFILNPSHGGHCSGTEVPCVTIVARQDKAPLYLIQFDMDNNISIPVYDEDTAVMIRIKEFMALYGLSDIKMRMLKVPELLLIQGFPKGYELFGNQTDQKKFIGNSVVPHVVTAWCEAMAKRTRGLRMEAA